MPTSCSCKKGFCFRCNKCNNCGCKCGPIRRNTRKRRRSKGLYKEDLRSDDDTTLGSRFNEARRSNDSNWSTSNASRGSQSIYSNAGNSKHSIGSKSKQPKNSGGVIPKLLELLDINSAPFKSVPGRKKRANTLVEDFSDEEKGRLVHLARIITEEICKVICPFDPFGLFEAMMIRSEAADDRLIDNIQKVVDSLPNNSIQRDCILAPVSKSYDAKVMKERFQIGKIKLASLRRKFNHLSSGLFLTPPIRSLQNFRKPDVQQAVRFILSDGNVQRISWGTKKVMVDGTEIEFPKLVRKQIIKYMYRDYTESFPKEELIGSGSFRKIAQVLTATDMRAKKAVDYVSGILMQGIRVVSNRGLAEPFLSSVIAPHIAPAAAWKKFLLIHPPTEDPTYPTVRQVKNKVFLKTQRKKGHNVGA